MADSSPSGSAATAPASPSTSITLRREIAALEQEQAAEDEARETAEFFHRTRYGPTHDELRSDIAELQAEILYVRQSRLSKQETEDRQVVLDAAEASWKLVKAFYFHLPHRAIQSKEAVDPLRKYLERDSACGL